MNAAKVAWWVVGVLASLAVPLAAVAAEGKKAAAAECPVYDGGLPWGAIFIVLFAMAGVCVVAFRNANRSP
jgi:hypothetical protein